MKFLFLKKVLFKLFAATFSHFCDSGKFSSPTLSIRTVRPKLFSTAFRGANGGQAIAAAAAASAPRPELSATFDDGGKKERKSCRWGKNFSSPNFCVPKM